MVVALGEAADGVVSEMDVASVGGAEDGFAESVPGSAADGAVAFDGGDEIGFPGSAVGGGAFVVFVPAIFAPFPGVAGEVVEAVGIGGEAADGGGDGEGVVVVPDGGPVDADFVLDRGIGEIAGIFRGRPLVAPGVFAIVPAAGGVLPLGFAGETGAELSVGLFGEPVAEPFGHFPVDEYCRLLVVVEGEASAVFFVPLGVVLGLEAAVLGIGDFVLPHVEGLFESDLMDGAFVFVAAFFVFGRAHLEGASRDLDELHGDAFAEVEG